ncbi:Lysine-specific permease [compost metagenome]
MLCIIVILGQNYQAFTGDRIDWNGALVAYLSLPLFLILWLGYKWIKKTKVVPLQECDFTSND